MKSSWALKARIYNPTRTRSVELELTVDTGFAGGLLLPLEVYLELGLNMYEEPKATGRLATGAIVELRTSRAVVEVGGTAIPCKAYTTLGRVRPLLGMEVVRRLKVTYDPKRGELAVEPDP